MAKTTSGVETGTQNESGINFSLLVKRAIALIIIVAVGMLLFNSLSENDAEKRDQKVLNKIDSVSGGASGITGIVARGKISDNTSEEIGYTGIDYPIDNVPTVIVSPSHHENLKNIQILLLFHHRAGRHR